MKKRCRVKKWRSIKKLALKYWIYRNHKFITIRCAPQRKGMITEVLIQEPKKPSSAKWKCCKVNFRINKEDKFIKVYIPGIGHNLRENHNILFIGCKWKDLPGIHYKVVWGKLDCEGVKGWKKAWSKYGVKLKVVS